MVRVLISALSMLALACGSPSSIDGGAHDAGRDASVAFDGGSDAGVHTSLKPSNASPASTRSNWPASRAMPASTPASRPASATDGTQAWIVGGGGLLLHRTVTGDWERADAGGDFTFLTVAVDGLGRVHAGGRTNANTGVIASSANGVTFVTVSGTSLGQGVGSIAAAGTRVYASADVIVFLDAGAWDRSMPQPASGFPGSLAAQGTELFSTGFGAVHHFADGGWLAEQTGGELQQDVCVSLLERTIVSEHGYSAQAQRDAGFAWMPWMSFDNEPVGCAYSPNGTLWLAVNSIHLDGGLHGSVFRSNGNFDFTEWTLPLLRAISASDSEVLVIGADSVWRISP
ncbi:MAG: hypothetical protein QM817_41655 [Archangium sp.]